MQKEDMILLIRAEDAINEMDCFCFEIKFKMLVETTKVWAQKVKRA